MEEQNEQSLAPGDISINAAYIYNAYGTLDVKNIITAINIYEDISSPFITGTLVISDTNNLISEMNFRGEERLRLELKTPILDIDRVGEFHIFKLEDRENMAERKLVYKLQFISIEAFTDQNTKVSKTFRGQISDSIQKICKNYLRTGKEIITEATVNNEIHTSNFWSPVQNITFLTKKALNTNNHSCYMFFENNEGFVFSSTEGLFKLPIQQEFTKGHHSRGTDPTQDENIEYMKVMDMSTPHLYNYINNHNNGLYGGSLYVTDIETKDISFMKYKAKDEYKKNGKLNEGLHIFDTEEDAFSVDSIIKTKVINNTLYENKPLDKDNRETQRNSMLSQTELVKTNIKVFGRCDYTVGRIINLTVYLDRKIDEKTIEEDNVDKMLSGKYLVSAINHEITNKSHFCYMELIKDTHSKN